MSNAVAIVSVATSGLVGMSGVAATVRSATLTRRWQGKEERVAELRLVLDSAADVMASCAQAVADAHRAICIIGPGSQAHRASEAAGSLGVAGTDLAQLWTIWNRVKVRRGAHDALAGSLLEVHKQLGHLRLLVTQELGNLRPTDQYDEAWAQAHRAQASFFEAAAGTLSAD